MQQICEIMPANVPSIRLLPNSDGEGFLSSLIRDLAQRFDTSAFAPHLALRRTVTAPDRLAEEIAVAESLMPVGKTLPLPSGLDGLRAQLLADAATDSAWTGTPVAIEAVGR
jgi:hypothetical protein